MLEICKDCLRPIKPPSWPSGKRYLSLDGAPCTLALTTFHDNYFSPLPMTGVQVFPSALWLSVSFLECSSCKFSLISAIQVSWPKWTASRWKNWNRIWSDINKKCRPPRWVETKVWWNRPRSNLTWSESKKVSTLSFPWSIWPKSPYWSLGSCHCVM